MISALFVGVMSPRRSFHTTIAGNVRSRPTYRVLLRGASVCAKHPSKSKTSDFPNFREMPRGRLLQVANLKSYICCYFVSHIRSFSARYLRSLHDYHRFVFLSLFLGNRIHSNDARNSKRSSESTVDRRQLIMR